MKTPKFTAEQLYAMNYVSSSHHFVPVYKRDLVKMKIPFVISVTPFPRAIDPPVLSERTFQHSPKCRNCTGIANNRYIKCPDGITWLCHHCMAKNSFSEKFPRIDGSAQARNSIVDFAFPKKADGSNKIIAPTSNPEFYFLVMERTEATIDNGLFSATIQKVKEFLASLNSGYF